MTDRKDDELEAWLNRPKTSYEQFSDDLDRGASFLCKAALVIAGAAFLFFLYGKADPTEALLGTLVAPFLLLGPVGLLVPFGAFCGAIIWACEASSRRERRTGPRALGLKAFLPPHEWFKHKRVPLWVETPQEPRPPVKPTRNGIEADNEVIRRWAQRRGELTQPATSQE